MWVWDILVLGTLEPFDLGTLGPLSSSNTSSNTSSYFTIHPLTFSYLFLLLYSFGMICLRGKGEGGVVTLENEIGDGPLTFLLILKSCGMGEWNPGTSCFLLHSLPLTSSHLLLIPPRYSSLLPKLLLTPPEGSQMTNQFIHEEISMLFCSEKFHGGWWVETLQL